ncbi:MAG: TonB-dependent receptor [Candidatus Azobacteroides sp.]|nr:TonB-dependent receptor [Candidatus Azobacteroides sp.]
MKNLLRPPLFLCMLLFLTGNLLYAQGSRQNISGIVTDETGETLIGVTVSVKGTTRGTLTDMDGAYSIDVTPGEILSFSYLRYDNKEITVQAGMDKLDVRMDDNEQVLEEVVVVGYGVQKKQTVTGAISSVKSKELTDVPVANLNNALAGKVAGLVTVQESGRPGEDAAKMYIRGQSTWVDSSPLIIVDGMERESFSQIDPNEVESISVLKDASSTAVYGVRGANGVILVTTKRGAVGKPRISFSANWGIQKPTQVPEFLGSYDQLVLMKQAYINDGKDPLVEAPSLLSDEALEGFRTGSDPYKYPNIVWYKAMTKSSAPQQQYNVNVSGGTESVKYFVSMGYLSQAGIFKYTSMQKDYNPDTYYNRFNFRSNLDVKINKYQTFITNLSGMVQEQNGFSNVNGLMQSLIAKPPYLHPIFNPDGSLSALEGSANPISKIAYSGYENTKTNNYDLIGTLRNDLSFITPGLFFDLSISYTSNVGNKRTYTDQIDTYFYSPITEQYSQITENEPFAYSGETTSRSFRREGVQLKLNYNKEIGLHDMKFTAVYNQQKDFSNVALPNVLMGFAGRAEYVYAGKYMGEFNIGYNGSENFAKGHRFGLFPAFSLGYILTEEDFMEFIRPVLPYFKIRGSLGLVGNDKIGSNERFLYQGLYQYYQSPNDNSSQTRYGQYYMFGTNNPYNSGGIAELRSQNPNLTWETSLKKNIGVDGYLFKNSLLTFSIDYFHESRKDILMKARSLMQTSGIPSPVYNIGEVKNWGYEIDLSHRNQIQNVEYFLKGNFSFARNKITNYDDPGKTPDYQKYAGYRIGQFRGYEVIGFFQDYEEIANSPDQSSLGRPIIPGDLKYRNYDNSDNVINDKDIIPIGYSKVPEIMFSFTPGFSWKGIDASIMFQGAMHSSVLFTSNAGYEFAGAAGGGQASKVHQDYWTPDNPNASYPSLHMVTKHSNKNTNSFHLKKGDYLRLKSIQIGYTLPKKISQLIGSDMVRLSLSGSNLYTWSYIDNFDPENISENGEVYPQQSVYNFGININF